MTKYARYEIEVTDPKNAKGDFKFIGLWNPTRSKYEALKNEDEEKFHGKRGKMKWPARHGAGDQLFLDLDFHVAASRNTEIIFTIPSSSNWRFRGQGFRIINLDDSTKNFKRGLYRTQPKYSNPIITPDKKTCIVNFMGGGSARPDQYLYVLYFTDPNQKEYVLDPIIKDGDSIPDGIDPRD